MSEINVRRAERADAGVMLSLVCALAEYEKLSPPDAEAQERLVEHTFGPCPKFETWIAEVDQRPVAVALVFETYSSFLARPTLHLEDLFVVPEARRKGVGTAVLRHLAREAVSRGCGRMEWTVLDWNEMAQNAYRKFGATILEDWRICRLSGEALQAAAGADP